MQLSRRILLEGTLGSPQTPDTLQSEGCRSLGHVAPFPNSTRASGIAPLPSCTASLIPLLCSALACPPHHIPVRLGLSIPARAEFSFGWCYGVASAMSVPVQYSRERHTGNRTRGAAAAETSLAFALCCELHNAVILRSRCCLMTQLICWQKLHVPEQGAC